MVVVKTKAAIDAPSSTRVTGLLPTRLNMNSSLSLSPRAVDGSLFRKLRISHHLLDLLLDLVVELLLQRDGSRVFPAAGREQREELVRSDAKVRQPLVREAAREGLRALREERHAVVQPLA